MATFPLDIRTELQLGGAWTDVSSDVYLRDVKQISRGLRDQGSAADPSSLTFTLNNKAGKYSRRNAMGPLFGELQQNTPVRVSVPGTGDTYLNLDGAAGNHCTTPDHSSLDITGDLDVRVELAANWYGPTNQWIMGKWGAAGQQSWSMYLYQGLFYFRRTADGYDENTGFAYWVRLPTLPDRAALRVTFDADDGTGRNAVSFYWAASLDSPTWTQIKVTLYGSGVGSIFSSTAPLQLGITNLRDNVAPNLQRLPVTARVYRAQVRNGIGGTVVASPDFRGLVDGATGVTDAQTKVWTLTGNAQIRDREDRFYGEISDWPLKWSPDDSDRWTPVQASGLLRRLGQGRKALDSALHRRIRSGHPVAYWPMEEGSAATRAFSPIPGVQPAGVSGVDWASASDLDSSAPLPTLRESGTLSAIVPSSMPSGQWQVEFVYNAADKIPPATPAPYADVISFSSPNGTVRTWTISLRKNGAHVTGYDAGGTDIVDKSIGIGDDVFHGWTRLRFWAINSGSTFTWRINWQDVGGDAGGLTGTVTGTCGRLSAVTANWGPLTEGWSIGHITVLPTANSALLDGSDDAYTGEDAWTRMQRLCAEEQVQLARVPGELTPELVGPQRQASLVELLESAAEADGGWLLESRNSIGLTYRDRSRSYTQEPALTLSYTAPGLAPGLDPVDDDSDVRNDVTVTRDGGSSGRAFLDSGPLSMQPPPLGVGVYDEGVTLSLDNDTQPEPIANWRLHLGTYDGARYPSVTVMLHKPGADTLIPQIVALREGDLIRLTDLPAWLSYGEDVDLIVQGWTETLDLYRWEITFNCAPGGPWNLAQADHPVYAKVDTDGSTLGASVSDSATTLSVVSADIPWTTDSAEMPILIDVGGEVMTVTAITSATSPQTFTVTRATNGVVKAHSAGTPVSLANPAVASL